MRHKDKNSNLLIICLRKNANSRTNNIFNFYLSHLKQLESMTFRTLTMVGDPIRVRGDLLRTKINPHKVVCLALVSIVNK